MTEDSTDSVAPGASSAGNGGAPPGSEVPATHFADRGVGVLDAIINRLTRVTSGGGFIAEIDGLRFFAITAVLAFHISGYTQWKSAIAFSGSVGADPVYVLFAQGYVGVPLFFAISGFILSLPFANRYLEGQSGPSLKAYFVRRVTRLEPPYIVNLIVCLALTLTVWHIPFGEALPHFLASVFYLHNVLYGTGSTINFVAWSLEVEVQFYVLAPLLCQVYRMRSTSARRVAIVLMGASTIILRRALGAGAVLHPLNLGAALEYFLVGLLLTDIYIVSWKRHPERHGTWDVAGFMGAAMVWASTWAGGDWQYLVAPSILIAYLGAFRGVVCNWIVRRRWIGAVGGMCYTIYLYHPFIKASAGRMTIKLGLTQIFGVNAILQVTLLSVIIVVCCSGLFLLLEKPFMYRDWPARIGAYWGAMWQKPDDPRTGKEIERG